MTEIEPNEPEPEDISITPLFARVMKKNEGGCFSQLPLAVSLYERMFEKINLDKKAQMEQH